MGKFIYISDIGELRNLLGSVGMPSYIISQLQIVGSEEKDAILPVDLLTVAIEERDLRDATVSCQLLQEEWGKGIKILISEFVTLNFRFLEAPVKVYLNTDINIVLKDEKVAMISSPRGIGLIAKGKPRSYVDSYIGTLISEYFSPLNILHKPYHLNDNEMDTSRWGEEVRKIRVDVYDFGKISFAGSDMQKKLNEEGLRSLIEKGTVSEFKVFSGDLNRVVSVSRLGVLSTSVDDISLMSSYILERLVWGDFKR